MRGSPPRMRAKNACQNRPEGVLSRGAAASFNCDWTATVACLIALGGGEAMRFEEYRKQDATALAGLIAKGELSAKTVLEVAIARAEAINGSINAIVHKQYEQAGKAVAAGLPAGPLSGVPFLIKDLGAFEKGEPATYGSRLFADFVADHDSAYVRRCKQAGLVCIGRSASPEFGLSPSTEPRLYGACKIGRAHV